MKDQSAKWKKTFLIIWSGQAFSLLGSSAAQFAIIWWLTLQTGSPAVLAFAGMAGLLPHAIIGPFAGVWVDRLSRKTVMIVADLFVAAGGAVLMVAFYAGVPHTWLIYIILFLRSVGSVFHYLAIQAAMPMLVPTSELTKTGGWSQFLQSGSLMLGPVLGTFIMTVISLPFVMLVDIAGAVIAAVTVAMVKIPDPEPDRNRTTNILSEMLDGLKLINENKPLKAITVPMMLAMLIYIPVGSFFPLMVNVHFGGTAWHASIIEFVFAGGLLVSSLILGVWGGLENKFLMINLALCSLGAALAGAGALPPSAFIAFVPLSAIMGMTGSFLNVPYTAYVQSTVPPASLGRVLSILSSMMTLAMPVGLFFAGPIAENVGIANWFLASGILIVITALLGYLMTRRY
ncbi:MFS transporter [Pelotomaculum propionicicum]|uniref:MFS transporter n=1 Tax=Pelotomaculum propionicicum TaxID=258475 RepID=UPI003B779343